MFHNLQDFVFVVYDRVLMQGLSVIRLTTSNTRHISLWDTLKCLLQIPLSREGTDQQEAGLWSPNFYIKSWLCGEEQLLFVVGKKEFLNKNKSETFPFGTFKTQSSFAVTKLTDTDFSVWLRAVTWFTPKVMTCYSRSLPWWAPGNKLRKKSLREFFNLNTMRPCLTATSVIPSPRSL